MTRTELNRIKHEIWQISESYTLLTKGKYASDLKQDEMRHLEFLHDRLKDLVLELKAMQDYEIPLVYKKMVNNLMFSLGSCVSQDYAETIRWEENKPSFNIGL